MKRIIYTLFLLTFWFHSNAQSLETIDMDYYAVPVKIPVFLSGNFGELRPNHFHAGIDIKTQGKTGIPVFAAADGYVSRISISPKGYGNVLYISHPNGTTTVYGHLEKFAKPIEDYIRNIQYERETFTINQILPENIFTVKKGEQIAKSGNSGSSGGPHLHFEIRLTKDDVLLNPLDYKMTVKDKTKPIIQALMVYPVSDDASVSGKTSPQRFEIIKTNNTYQLKVNKPITVSGQVGFGIQTVDLLDGVANKCGISKLKLTVDNQLIFSFNMNKLVMDQTKYMNSHVDYAYSVKTGQRIYRTWLEPGNKLSIYDSVINNGLFLATDDRTHLVSYEVSDANGNTSSFSFKIQAQKSSVTPKEPKGKLFRYDKNNKIHTDELELSIPEGALYSDVDFIFEEKPSLSKFYSAIYQLHNTSVPLHFVCPLRIKAKNLPERLQDKVMLAQIDPSSGRILSATGKYDNGWVEGNIRVLGNYALAVDTIAPKITPLIFTEQKTLKDPNSLKFKVADSISGIETFRGTIDGKWVLFEYDLKNNLLNYTFDKERFEFNKEHSLILEVTDFKGNTSTYKTKFHK